uniref:Pyruvate ferredoxin oxidoreductase n=1 Tax=Candidatus Caldatribacterium californiense TaxID=1454726 RepID=A0A7V4DEM9_9BACT
MPTLKELAKRPERLTPGHRLCAGCGAPIAVRLILAAADKPVVAANATGCLEVSTSIFPYTAWNIPWIHNAFENAAATIAGVESMYRAKRKRGEIEEEIYFVAFGGDGGTYDIGLQALSGALERGHRFLYVCYNNEAYMNTGIQRSSATPLGAWTTTSPVGRVLPGKTQWRKNLTEIVAAHGIPYVAQSVASNWRDLVAKAEKAFHTDGPSFINVLASCNRGWRHEPSETLKIMQLAVDCCVWPLYEVENGVYRLTYKPKEKKPVEEWLRVQGRFRHLLAPENRHLVEAFQRYVDEEWERLLKKCGEA